jgi:uracil-DNA glycosylase family 4
MAKRMKSDPSCQLCDLYKSCQAVNIMGQGPLDAEVMIITDSPGYSEDQTGRALDGNMRSFLKDLLEEAGLKIKNCYITNAVKCKPPQGYKIKVKEMNACKPYLDREIKTVKPRFVLMLGANALKAVMGKEKVSITEMHGRRIDRGDGIVYVPAFSPGVAWRDPSKLDHLKRDLRKFAGITKGRKIEKPKLNFHVVESFDDFNQMIRDLKKNKVTSWDIETTSLNRFEGVITMMGFGLKDKQWILPLEFPFGKFRGNKGLQTKMVELATEAVNYRVKARTNVTHNGKFDNLWTREHFKVRVHNHFDTMIAHYCLDENDGHSLKYLARILLDAEDWDVDIGTKTGGVLTKKAAYKLYEYLAYDVYYTRKLYFHLKKELANDDPIQDLFTHLMMPVFHTYENIQMEGVYIHKERFDDVELVLKERLEDVRSKLDKIGAEYGVSGVNWGSSQQLGKFLFETLGLDIVEKTKTGAPSTGESVLLRLRDKHPIVEHILEFKGIKQQISFFIDGWKKRMHKDKIWPNFNIHVTVTGRTSSNEPNLQQVPRDKKIRTLIGAPPGWTMVEADYSQVELRVVAMLSGDTAMTNAYIMGEDIHSKTASSLNGKPMEDQDKEDRKKAKATNFGFVYGMGHFKFADYARDNYGVTLSLEEAKQYRDRFFETYSDLPAWHQKQKRIAKAYKQVRNLIGRLRRLPEVDSPDKQKAGEAERQSINSPVQSFASDVMLMSLVELDQKMPRDRFKIVGSVHDAGLYMIRNDSLNELVPIIKETMQSPKILDTLGVTMTVPLVADVSIGDWGNGVDWDGEYIDVKEDGGIELIVKD